MGIPRIPIPISQQRSNEGIIRPTQPEAAAAAVASLGLSVVAAASLGHGVAAAPGPIAAAAQVSASRSSRWTARSPRGARYDGYLAHLELV